MMQIIAVHSAGTAPKAMEIDLGELDFVQKQALARLPRSPSGVPELRALVKTDGNVQFKFKVPPEKFSWANLPELLTLWEEKYTTAMLKVVGKEGKAERAAIASASMWKEPGDSDAGEDSPSGAKLQSSTAKPSRAGKAKRIGKHKLPPSVLAATTTTNELTGEVTQKTTSAEKAVAGMAVQELVNKAKESLSQVQFADPLETARLNESQADGFDAGAVRGQSSQDVPGASDAAGVPAAVTVNAAAAASAGESAGAVEAHGPRVVQEALPQVGDAPDKALKAIERHKSGAKGPKLLQMDPFDLFKHLDAESKKPNTGKPARKNASSDTSGQKDGDGAQKEALGATVVASVEKGALVESCNESDQKLDGCAKDTQSCVNHAQSCVKSTQACAENTPACDANRSVCGANTGGPEVGGFEGYDDAAFSGHYESAVGADHAQIDAAPGAGQLAGVPVADRLAPKPETAFAEKPGTEGAGPVSAARSKHNMDDWSGLVSFRLASKLDQASALVLPTGERFEALGHLTLLQPLAVEVEWMQAAAIDAEAVLLQQEQLGQATDWLKDQLAWRCAELMRWLGKRDLVSPPDADKPSPAAAKRREVAMADWVKAGTEMASLAQDIAMDIAMLDLQVAEIERVSAGMPTWAIETMQQMVAFKENQTAKDAQAEIDVEAERPSQKPGTAFRDSWRSELLRIDAWCLQFKSIQVARQVGLFGTNADAKLLIRIEQLLERAKTWCKAPAQPSRALAVWLAFVLSLDHSAVAMSAFAPAEPSTPVVNANPEKSHV